LYQIWIADALKNGPFDFYYHSPTFNYPPLIVYFFWVYGQIASLLGLAGNELALKIVVSLSLPAIAWLAWRFLIHQTGQTAKVLDRKLTPVFLLFGFNLCALYNPAIWGQTEVLLALFLFTSLYLIYRQKYWLALIFLGFCLSLKLQAIMAGPLLLVLIWKKAGWKLTVRGFGLSALITVALALPVFGFRLSEISKYVFQGELGGQVVTYSRAYNFSYLLNYNFNPSNLVTALGLGTIFLVFLILGRLIAVKALHPFTVSLILVLSIATFFTFAIKMHERYLYYTLPFFLLASAYTYLDPKFSRQVRWLWLAFSLDGLLQLIFSRHTEIYTLFDPVNNDIKVVNTILENIYNWTGWLFEARIFLETSLSLATIGLCAWTAYLVWQSLSVKGTAKESVLELSPESSN
jgi:Gpi18-like mannosyltransferase